MIVRERTGRRAGVVPRDDAPGRGRRTEADRNTAAPLRIGGQLRQNNLERALETVIEENVARSLSTVAPSSPTEAASASCLPAALAEKRESRRKFLPMTPPFTQHL